MLSIIGLGLGDAKDITLRGQERIASADTVYLEGYTSILAAADAGAATQLKQLEVFFKKKMILLQRNGLEEESQKLLDQARDQVVALLVVGDPLSATTHIELYRQAHEQQIPCEIIHNASIMTAVAETGLQLYKFGRTGSVPFPENSSSLETPYNVIAENKARGLHTLLLLDLDPLQQRFLSIRDAIAMLLDIEERKEKEVFTPETRCIVCVRLGSPDQKILVGTVHTLQNEAEKTYGAPPFSLIVPGDLHFVEEEMLHLWEEQSTEDPHRRKKQKKQGAKKSGKKE